jgi:exosome complex protein LRP1
MNNNVLKIFKKKEEQLLGNYKEEMDHAQEQVRQLSELTSDTQLKKKVQQKKEEVEKERQKILQSSLEFSNQCK